MPETRLGMRTTILVPIQKLRLLIRGTASEILLTSFAYIQVAYLCSLQVSVLWICTEALWLRIFICRLT